MTRQFVVRGQGEELKVENLLKKSCKLPHRKKGLWKASGRITLVLALICISYISVPAQVGEKAKLAFSRASTPQGKRTTRTKPTRRARRPPSIEATRPTTVSTVNRAKLQAGAGVSQPVDILVWKVGSPHEGEIPEKAIPIDLLIEAKELGYRLGMETFPAKGFAHRFFDAVLNGTEPDVLAIDNYGIIEGITTALGNFAGIGSPRITRTLIRVTESFNSLASGRGGWQFLVSTSRNHKKAKSLVFKTSKCDPEFTGNRNVVDKRTTGEIKAAALSTSLAYFTGDRKKLDHLSGGEYGNASLAIGSGWSNLGAVKICRLWGNERLAFVKSLASYEGDRSMGQKTILIVISKQKPNSVWNLVLLSDYTRVIEELYDEVPKLLGGNSGRHETLVLIDPPDQAQLKRFPRPKIEWSSGGEGVVAYLVDSQFSYKSRWSGSYLKLVRPDSTGGGTIKVEAPGAGMQPHRWRVWAIYDTGEVVISNWRTINYTN